MFGCVLLTQGRLETIFKHWSALQFEVWSWNFERRLVVVLVEKWQPGTDQRRSTKASIFFLSCTSWILCAQFLAACSVSIRLYLLVVLGGCAGGSNRLRLSSFLWMDCKVCDSFPSFPSFWRIGILVSSLQMLSFDAGINRPLVWVWCNLIQLLVSTC